MMYTHPLWQELEDICKRKQPHILLCEGADERVAEAAGIAAKKKLARISVLSAPHSLTGVQCIDSSRDREAVAEYLYQRRKDKGMTEEEAKKTALKPAPFGFGLLALGKVDGVVCGAVETTAETVRSAFLSLGPKHGHKVITGLFLVETPYVRQYGDNGGFVFADCGVAPDPSSRMLAYIAHEAADAYRFYFHNDPRVAFLSFSTAGSAEHERVDKVREAARTAAKLFPTMISAGELQLDAALDSLVAQRKGAGSLPAAGKANVLVFPDLDAGNITYKAVQRFGSARTIGPVLWGLEKPASDLSRGCSVEDIVCTICAVGAQV